MDPAEDVGGDFYDFYTVGDNRLVFCIADVSGKSIPAAMFMMRVKTLLRSSMEKYNDLKVAFEETNRQICESNEAGLFVTVWMGVCDMQKGVLQFVNAGHNPPLLCRYGEKFEYLKTHPNLVVGGMARTKYQVHSIDIQPGDRIYLYTDGVTEAKNADRMMYGEARLLDSLNRDMDRDAEERPSIEDNGILYDPLSAEAPDVTLPAGKRSIGGLGLFMVKKIASSVEYAEKDGWNDLKLIFEFDLPSAEKN